MRKLVTGRAGFVDDLSPDGLLHAAIVGSPHPHARVKALDTAAARALSGVVAVLTHEDVLAAAGDGAAHPPLFSGLASYLGAPVAAVAAEDPEIAARAAELIRGSYEPLPEVAWSSALADEGKPVVVTQVVTGEGERGRGTAGTVVEVTVGGERGQVFPAEPPVALTRLDEDGVLEVRSATSSPLRLRLAIADALGLPVGRIHVERPEVGGDFGARDTVLLETLCAAFTLRTGRPVRMALRPDDPAGLVDRGAWLARARATIRDGALTEVEIALSVECDAAPRADHLEAELRRAASALSIYRLGATRFVGRAFATHSRPAHPAAMVAATVALEALVDRAAAAVGQEAAAFRKGLLNDAATTRGASALLARGAREVAARMKSARSLPATWGMALARVPLPPGSAHAVLVCNEDGSFTVSCTPCEHAAAVVSVVEALVAERLQVTVDRVATAHGNPTDSPVPGLAEPWLVLRAAREAADEMARKIRRAPGARGGLVTRGEATAEDAPVPLGAFFARVDLDPETGRIALAELVQALAASPEDGTLLARAEGDALRGAGAALFEGAGGRAALARIGDLPAPVTLLASARGGAGPLGDVAFVGVMAAIANAVARVTAGAPIHLPFEPERVLLSLPEAVGRG